MARAAEDAHYKGTSRERPVFDFSHDGVMRSVEESLTRLGLDRIDVLLVHDPDDHYDDAVAGAFRALQRLRADGTVKAIGAGMNQSEMFKCVAQAVAVRLLPARRPLHAARPERAGCAISGLPREEHGILLGGIYNSGILANPHPGAKFNYQDADAALIARALELDELCRKHGTELKAAALQFCMAHPAGHRGLPCWARATPREVSDNIAMSEKAVPQAFWQELRARKLVDARAPVAGRSVRA